jgi:hypothetical protein
LNSGNIVTVLFTGSASLQRREAAGPASGDMNDGRWTGEASRKGGFRTEEQEVPYSRLLVYALELKNGWVQFSKKGQG